MKKINLREYDPFYQADYYVDIPEEFAELLDHMNSPELLEQLMSAIDQNAKNSFVRKSVDKLP